jgi:hypothetical protein
MPLRTHDFVKPQDMPGLVAWLKQLKSVSGEGVNYRHKKTQHSWVFKNELIKLFAVTWSINFQAI